MRPPAPTTSRRLSVRGRHTSPSSRQHEVGALVGEGTSLSHVTLRDGRVIAATAAFVKAPVVPRSSIARALGCEVDADGYIVTNDTGATSHPLVWAAGDVRRPPPLPHQVVLAAADGSAAGIAIHKAFVTPVDRVRPARSHRAPAARFPSCQPDEFPAGPTTTPSRVMTDTHIHSTRSAFQPIMWGLLVGAVQVASPVAFRWLEPATLHALYIAFIAAVYIGFAVADGRTKVIAVESSIAAAFVVLAAVGVTGSAWLLVAAYAAHGVKDLWQDRAQFVAGTRWWPPFCATIDFLVAAILALGAANGVSLH